MKFDRKYYLDELIARKHNGMIKIITGLRPVHKIGVSFGKKSGIIDEWKEA